MPPEIAVVPPTSGVFSITTLLSPRVAATAAAVMPPAPAPITTTSYSLAVAASGMPGSLSGDVLPLSSGRCRKASILDKRATIGRFPARRHRSAATRRQVGPAGNPCYPGRKRVDGRRGRRLQRGQVDAGAGRLIVAACFVEARAGVSFRPDW